MPSIAPSPLVAGPDPDPLARFSAPVRTWFASAFAAPTPAQVGGWAAIAAGRHTLIHAPTGSGKTLAAFLWCLDRLVVDPPADGGRSGPGSVRTLYVSPLKALAYDIERNLRSPLTGISMAAERLGSPVPRISIASRTGDTPVDARRDLVRHPPDILVTTPESLYLLLTSSARVILRDVESIIVDEVHTMAGTKRGAHLAVSLERLEAVRGPDRPPAQRIGLSATQRPLDVVARFLGGVGPGREVSIVDAGAVPALELEVVVPVDDMTRLGDGEPDAASPGSNPEARTSIWPAIHPLILDLVRAHRSTIVFTNSRRLAERLAQRLNELAGTELVRAHHGSVAREQRVEIEEDLKAGRSPAIVATSSLELGIDMGAVDLVIQVEAPTSVASGLQRVGRAGHHVGAPSRGVFFPKYRGDLLETAVVVERMRAGAIEATAMPRNPLDVLAQQIVAMTVMDDWTVDGLGAVIRRAAPFESLTPEALEGVLGMLAGSYPSDEFAELRPRIAWDRAMGAVVGRRDARVVAVTSGGTIPDRGLFGVFLVGEPGAPGRRVGELDEEMVYEARAGEVITLGASSWRIEDIGHDRVDVSPAPGVPGRLPFWRGDAIGRPVDLGRAIGAFVRGLEVDLRRGDAGRQAATSRLRTDHTLDPRAAANLLSFVEEEMDATGAVPTDRRIVVERFRDELGDWRVVVLSPFGGRVHAPWSIAIESRLAERLGTQVQSIWSDDGIAIRLPDGAGETDAETVDAVLFPDADEVEDLVVDGLAGSSLFASRFRENAARALLLPRRRPGRRTPLWQQRQRSADLLAVAARYGSFPILVETYRECLSDVFDVAALSEILRGVARRDIAVHRVETVRASPFASSLLFDYVATYMYEGDAPLAERRAGALALDRDLLRELLGQEELRELLDPAALADVELDLQWLADDRRIDGPERLHDLVRHLGDLRVDEIAARSDAVPDAVDGWLAILRTSRRATVVRIAGEDRWIAIEDVGRYRDAIGVEPPPGTPDAFLAPVTAALDGLVARWARTHGPFLAAEPAARWGLAEHVVEAALDRLRAAGRVVRGEFRPGGAERDWCDADVLRSLRRRSLARLRHEVEPVDQAALARFLVAWHGVVPVGGDVPSEPRQGIRLDDLDRLIDVVDRLAGAAIPASVLERDVLPARLPAYEPRLLDELGALGEIGWVGRGALNRDDGRIVLDRRGRSARWLSSDDPDAEARPTGPRHDAIRQHLGVHGASFYRDLHAAAGGGPDRDVLDALWDLVWAGEVTNDTFAPVRALRWRRPGRAGVRRRPPRLVSLGPPEAAGRWSLVDRPSSPVSARDRAAALHTVARTILDRHGIVARSTLGAEDVAGGFAALYPVLRAMEEAGHIRRGYFVDGLGGAQFALPAAIERLRALREPDPARPRVDVLAATDPANPYGASLPWPRRDDADRRPYPRVAGAYVVLVDGTAAIYVDRGGMSLQPLPAADDPPVSAVALGALRSLVDGGRFRELVVTRVAGESVTESPWRPQLLAAGFGPGYRGLVLRQRRP